MRREGLEFCISRPEVITHQDESGNTLEPIEQLLIDVPEEYQGFIIEKLARRQRELRTVENAGTKVIRIEFEIPTAPDRLPFGIPDRYSRLGIMAARFVGYGPWCGEITARNRGSVVSMDTGPGDRVCHRRIAGTGRAVCGTYRTGLCRPDRWREFPSDDLPCNPTRTQEP